MRVLNSILIACVLAGIIALGVASLPGFPNHGFSGQICHYNAAAEQKDCAVYSLLPFVLIKIGEALNDYSAALTAVATVFVAWFTFSLRQSSEKMWRASLEQGNFLEASIMQATRSATAMENVAGSLTINAEQIVRSVDLTKRGFDNQAAFMRSQQRAYVCALTGRAFYQEIDKNIRFEVKPVLRNFGFTPARKVECQARAAVLPVPVPADFKFTLPPKEPGNFILPPQVPIEVSAMIDDFVDESQVEDIKTARGQALYVWGAVSYLDIFNRKRRLTFFQQVYWTKGRDGGAIINGIHLPRHNKAN